MYARTHSRINARTHIYAAAVQTFNLIGIPAALALAKEADVVVLAVGIDKSIEGEGIDRPNIRLPGKQELFAKLVLELNKPTVLVLTNGGVLGIDALLATRNGNGPDAIVEAFNPGSTGAWALAAQLFGVENRWGKLPVTMYSASYPDQVDLASFDMAKPPGRTYKYFTGKPLFPFGYAPPPPPQRRCVFGQIADTARVLPQHPPHVRQGRSTPPACYLCPFMLTTVSAQYR